MKIPIIEDYLIFYKNYMFLQKIYQSATMVHFHQQTLEKIPEISNFVGSWNQRNIKNNNFYEFCYEICLINNVDNFKNFLCDIVYRIYEVNGKIIPSTSATKETIEQNINKRNFKQLYDYLEKELDVKLNAKDINNNEIQNLIKKIHSENTHVFNNFPSLERFNINEEMSKLAEFGLQIRNLYVHYRGIINSKFVEKINELGFNSDNYIIGQYLKLNDKEVDQLCLNYSRITAFISLVILIKYKEKVYCDDSILKDMPY